MMLIVPLTLGSIMKLRPVISATALTTASMSALTKLSVTVSSGGAATGAKPAQNANASADEHASPRRPWTRVRRCAAAAYAVSWSNGRQVEPIVTALSREPRGENCTNRTRAAEFRERPRRFGNNSTHPKGSAAAKG